MEFRMPDFADTWRLALLAVPCLVSFAYPLHARANRFPER
jgi:hypothetical protein